MEDGSEQPSASAYVLCLYKSHGLYILDQKLEVEQYLWTLESIKTILTKIENQDVLII